MYEEKGGREEKKVEKGEEGEGVRERGRGTEEGKGRREGEKEREREDIHSADTG